MDRFAGEPTLEEVLSDPIIFLMMKADRLDMLHLCEILLKAGSDAASPVGNLPPGQILRH